MRKFIFVLLAIIHQTTNAKQPADATKEKRLAHKEINFLYNPAAGIDNPSRIALNKVQTITEATASMRAEQGKLHAVDEGRRLRDIGVSIYGLQKIGKRLNLQGTISYGNQKEYEHRWNNTYMVSADNPFIIADSIHSDVNTEEFRMNVIASYLIGRRMTGGLELSFRTGSLSDQTDPRPKTNSMHFTASPGALWAITPAHTLGASMKVDIYRSDITHAVIDNMTSNLYFLMKGMGDNQIQSTNDLPGYPRDYKGTKVRGAVQWLWNGKNKRNTLELSYQGNEENSKDGGSAYTFKSGDFSENTLAWSDRLSMWASPKLVHNITLKGCYKSNSGMWYDQEWVVDPKHANRKYYRILNKSKVQSAQKLCMELAYRIDGVKEEMPNWHLGITSALASSSTTHYDVKKDKQEYNISTTSLSGGKVWRMGRCLLENEVGASFRTALGTPKFASVRHLLEAQYERPRFEYETARQLGADLRLAMSMPVKLYKAETWLTVFAGGSFRTFLGEGTYTDMLNSTDRWTADVGLRLIL